MYARVCRYIIFNNIVVADGTIVSPRPYGAYAMYVTAYYCYYDCCSEESGANLISS